MDIDFNAITSTPSAYLAYMKEFTDTFARYEDGCIYSREVACLGVQWSVACRNIEKTDLFAGRYSHPIIGFSPQAQASFGYYIHTERFLDFMTQLSGPELLQAEELLDYWSERCTDRQVRNAYPEKLREFLYEEDLINKPVIAVALYRLAGTHCDFDKLVRLGINGLRDELTDACNQVQEDSDTYKFYQSSIELLNLLRDILLQYAYQANELLGNENLTLQQQADLSELESDLRYLAQYNPATFRQGIQLVYLYANLACSMNYGRMDEYLGDLYVADIESGRIDSEEAVRIVSALWRQIREYEHIDFDGRVVIGGMGRRNPENADALAFVILEATRRVRDIIPQLTLRFYEGQNPGLYSKGLDIIATGNPYPILYNDDVNVPSVANAFGIAFEEAQQYIPFGCGEYVIYHRSIGTPSGAINLLQALSTILHKGVNAVSGKREPCVWHEEYGNFLELMQDFEDTVSIYLEQLAQQEKIEYDVAAKESPFLMFSLLYDDCIKRGKPLLNGGVEHLGGTIESYGNTNTSDSLAAIRRLVFDEKRLTLSLLVEALDADFEGYDEVRQMLLQVPKYGNDDPYADDIRVRIDHHICNVARDLARSVGLDSYLVVIINNNTNTILGQNTAASADGRKAFTYMANANAATGGADKNGITALLNSLVKTDTSIHAGAVQNIKFSREMLTTRRTVTEQLLSAYWKSGGAQCMINCLCEKDLEQALLHPEEYASLIVRVGGFSARFIDLDPEVQREIMSRTLY